MKESRRRAAGMSHVELDDVAAEELGIITGAAMLKDETRGIRSGLCAERCPWRFKIPAMTSSG